MFRNNFLLNLKFEQFTNTKRRYKCTEVFYLYIKLYEWLD